MDSKPGFKHDFLKKDHLVLLPQPTSFIKNDIAKIKNTTDNLLHHLQYSVMLSKERRLAIFSSANYDAKLKQAIPRRALTSSWKVEKGIGKKDILGHELYKLSNMKLERGHLTPADIMEWGLDVTEGTANANDTFYFSNAAPQIKRLNGTEWGHLEAFVGKESLKTGNSRLSVHTGCVFLPDDPEYIFEIDGKRPRIPQYFWKVIYYVDKNSAVCRIGFLMGQKKLLDASELVQRSELEKAVLHTSEVLEAFADLLKNKVFQVNIALIEKLTKLKFSAALDKITDSRRIELTMKEVEVSVPESHTLGGKASKKQVAMVEWGLDGLIF